MRTTAHAHVALQVVDVDACVVKEPVPFHPSRGLCFCMLHQAKHFVHRFITPATNPGEVRPLTGATGPTEVSGWPTTRTLLNRPRAVVEICTVAWAVLANPNTAAVPMRICLNSQAFLLSSTRWRGA